MQMTQLHIQSQYSPKERRGGACVCVCINLGNEDVVGLEVPVDKVVEVKEL